MSTFFRAIGNFFRKDWMFKLVSLAIAALLWFFVIAQENPTRVKEYENIPVTFIGAETLAEKGLCMTESPEELLEAVNVSVEAEISDLQKLTEDEITASVDMSNITTAGEYTLNVRARSLRGSVSAVSPSKVTVSVEDLAEREVPVEIQIIGNDDPDLYYGDVITDTDTVVVEGSQSEVEHYSKAVVVVDVSGMDSTYKESRTITLTTDDGNVVSSEDYYGALPSVIVELPIYPTVSIPIDKDAIMASAKGVADGYEIIDVVLSDDEIKVAAEEEDLDSIKAVKLERVSLEGAMYDTTVQIGVELPKGAIAIAPKTVNATFKIAEHQDKRSFGSVPVEVRNLGSGLVSSINPETVDVVVRGSAVDLKELGDESVRAYIDLSGFEPGVHNAVIKYEIDSQSELIVSSLTETVEVEITKN